MEVIQLTILLFFCYICQCETSVTICGDPKYPYKTPDNYCANFSEICFKKDDPTCNNIQNVCKQCPPSNYSAIMYLDIQNLKNEMTSVMSKFEQIMKNINYLKNKFTLLRNETVQTNKEMLQIKTKVEVSSIIIILITLIGLVVVVLEIRFKLITKLICLNKNKKYEPLRSRKMRSDTKEFQELNQKVSELFSKFEEISNQIQRLSDQNSIVKFKYKNKKINLKVYDNDCVVQIKKKICSQLSNTNDNDYKIMKLKYNGNILDDNRYLLSYITDRNIYVDCEIDQSINDQEIVIIKVKSVIVPKLLQMQKKNTIDDLKTIISRFINLSDCFIIKKWKEIINNIQSVKEELLKEESKIEDYNFKDKDCVKVIQKQNGKLYIRSIFQYQDQLVIEYSNLDLISTIIHKAANKFGSDPNYFFLFLYNAYLDENKYIFEYNIDEKSPIEFYCLMKINEPNTHFKLIGHPIDHGNVSETYKGEQISNNKQITVIEFLLIMTAKQMKEDKIFLNGIAEYQITRECKRFAQFINVYKDETFIYIIMDYMPNGTLKTLLDSGTDITEVKIIKWSKQILEGLKYLNDHNIIVTEIISNNILVDENEDLKLRYFRTPRRMYENIFRSYLKKVAFVSPEMGIDGDGDGNKQSIVWSFGALLINIINYMKNGPSIKMEEVKEIVKDGKIKDKFPSWISNNLKDFIDSCLKIDPDQRLTIDQLIEHIFLQKF